MWSSGLHSYLLWLQGPPNDLYLKEYSQIIMKFMIDMRRNGKMKGQKAFSISNVTCYVEFRAPYLPSFDFRVLQMSCIWKNIHKSSLPQCSIWMWLEMGNRMIDMDFEFHMWHAMWSSRLHMFLLSTSGSSRCLVFERILSNYHNHHDECD